MENNEKLIILKENIKIRESIIDNTPNLALKLLREQYIRIYENWQVQGNLNVM